MQDHNLKSAQTSKSTVVGDIELNKQTSSPTNISGLTIEKKPTKNSTSFKKDSGYSWVIVLGSFLMQSCCYGLPLTFGIFQDYYLNNVFVGGSRSKISTIGTVCLATMGLGSSLSGKLMDHIGIRKVIAIGTFFVFISHLLASFSTQIWHLVLTQGFLLGIGCSILYIPSNAIVSHWFDKRKGLAYGICSSGSGLGTLFYSIINAKLLKSVGFQWTLRVNGLIMVVQLIFCYVILRPHPSYTKKSVVFRKKEVLNAPFVLLCFSMLFFACSYPTTLFYLPGQISANGFTLQQASVVLSILSGLSAGGRVLVGFGADYIGHLNVYVVCTFMTTLSYIFLFFGKSYQVYLTFGVIFGLFSGGLVGIFGAVVSTLFGTHNISLIMGLTYAPTGIGELIGPPSAGLIMDRLANNNYLNGFCCILLLVSSIFILAISMHLYVKRKRNSTVVNTN